MKESTKRKFICLLFMATLLSNFLFVGIPDQWSIYKQNNIEFTGQPEGSIGFWADIPQNIYEMVQLLNDTLYANMNTIYLMIRSYNVWGAGEIFTLLLEECMLYDISVIMVFLPTTKDTSTLDSPVYLPDYEKNAPEKFMWWRDSCMVQPDYWLDYMDGKLSVMDYFWWADFFCQMAYDYPCLKGFSFDDFYWSRFVYTIYGPMWFFDHDTTYLLRAWIHKINPNMKFTAVWYFYHIFDMYDWMGCFDGIIFFYGGYGGYGFLDGISVICDDLDGRENYFLNRDGVRETYWFDEEIKEISRRLGDKILIVGLFCIDHPSWVAKDGTPWNFSYVETMIPKAFSKTMGISVFRHAYYANGSIHRDLLPRLRELIASVKGYEAPFDCQKYDDKSPPSISNVTFRLAIYFTPFKEYRYTLKCRVVDDVGVASVSFIADVGIENYTYSLVKLNQPEYYYVYFTTLHRLDGGWIVAKDYAGNVVYSEYLIPSEGD